MTTFAFTLAGGSGIFAAFIVLFTIAVTYSLYSRRGSGINQHPHGNVYTNAPGASGSSTVGNDRIAAANLTRGTR
jgi:cbb3-type cytochrome oxidase subunit 3